jgi:Icc-related predicted phosphoesterase
MIIYFGSDLHMEFGNGVPSLESCSGDILILAGDCFNAEDIKRHPFFEQDPTVKSARKDASLKYQEFLTEASKRFRHVLAVMGNHEHYSGKLAQNERVLRENFAKFPNVTLLENETVKINGVVFVGGTLWTDLNKGSPLTCYYANLNMNDYKRIHIQNEHQYRKLTPADTYILHLKTKKFIFDAASQHEDDPVVVITHHAPSFLSIHPRYHSDREMNGNFCSDLSEEILDHPNIKYWFHGHVHDDFEYEIGECKVLCNPRGYEKYEARAHAFNFRFLEIES